MKKSLKIVSVLMMAIMMIMVATPVFANNISTVTDIPITDPTTGTEQVAGLAGRIIGLVRWIALIGGTVIIAILGIKYMMGSLEEKAEYKKSLVPLIVGIVVVMGATVIADLLYNTFKL